LIFKKLEITMKIEEKDKPKVMLMGIIAICGLGYLGFTMMNPAGGTGNKIAEAQGKPSPSPKVPAPNKDGVDVASGEKTVLEYLKNYQLTGVSYDPFKPNGSLVPPPSPSPTPAVTPATPGPMPTLPPPGGNNGGGFQPNATAAPDNSKVVVVATPTPAPPPNAPDYTVKGVLIGDESVAILRQGDDLKFVQEGYPVGNGYVVGDINKNSVDLVYERNPLYHKRIMIGSGGK
jgi:hypothetical protein